MSDLTVAEVARTFDVVSFRLERCTNKSHAEILGEFRYDTYSSNGAKRNPGSLNLKGCFKVRGLLLTDSLCSFEPATSELVQVLESVPDHV